MESKSTTVEGLRLALEALGLNTKGHKPELKQRLRKAKKKLIKTEEESSKNNDDSNDVSKQENAELKSIQQPYDYYLFFDVEATCEEGGGFTYPNEIIEFPIVLVDGKTFNVVDEFQSYVKPTIHSTLSDFCINLTGISQSTVDSSPSFIEVLENFQSNFLSKYDLFQSASATFVTDGPFDIRDFITKQCHHSHLKRPAYFKLPWINIRKLFKDFYNQKENKNINNMLNHLELEFRGREHSGLDDARNLAAIGKRMHQDGCIFKTNCRYDEKRHHLYHNLNGGGRKKR